MEERHTTDLEVLGSNPNEPWLILSIYFELVLSHLKFQKSVFLYVEIIQVPLV